ncbi:LPD5 domain-containing protein [Endozoicomonas sp. Mp262]|uniref:LPD5 domain-containing protein n=1 Tax=Endozoicomonas sp. Mp262 TaxID=2919499 RepID=UPI0021D8A873
MLKFKDFANTPEYQQADPATRLEMRRAYFDTQIRPRIPARYVDTQWQQFDQATGELGDPTQGYFGDTLDAFQQGFYRGIGDLASGADYLVGGDGENAAADYLRGVADDQLNQMSPEGREAMQGFGIEEKPDSFFGYGLKDTSSWRGFRLQLAAAAGSFLPSIIPGGAVARGLSWGAKGKRAFDLADKARKIETVDDARRVKKLNDRINRTAFATGYGATGGAMIGGGAAEQTKQVVLNSGYEDLKDLPRFQELYRQEYESAGGGDTRAPFERARELLAAEAAKESFAPAAGVGALSMGVAGPLLDRLGRGLGATGRISNAGKGVVVEGAQEFTEGAGQQVASNLGQQSIGMEVDTTQGAMAEGLTGAIVGGPVGGVVGAVPTPQGRPDQGDVQQTLKDLHSQRQTLQDQMTRPDADRAILTGLLRKNAIATAQAESLVRGRQEIPLGKAVDLPPQVPPQTPPGSTHQPHTESTRQQHPDDPRYTGNEETDLQLYASRASALNKLLHGQKWTKQQRPLKRQLKALVKQRKELEKKSQTLAATQTDPFTPADSQPQIEAISKALKQGDSEAASQLITALAKQTGQELKQLARQQPDPEAATQEQFTDRGTIDTPLDELSLSDDVPQFKSGANENGVVEPLGGEFDRTGLSPIQVWVRKDGRKEVISGRHRLDLARRSGEETIPAQYHYEAEGFDRDQAAVLDAILNIREGQGKVRDYVGFIQSTGLTEEEADAQGILARATGRRAYTIATQGGDTLIAAHGAGEITDEAATRIARAAPKNEALQAVGLKALQDGKTITLAENMVKAVGTMTQGQQSESEGGDLFGFDDSALKEAENLARQAAAKQAAIQKTLSAVQGAAKRPDLAAKEGVDVKNPAAVKARIAELKKEKQAWENWHTNPELTAQLRESLPEPEAKPELELNSPSEKELAAQEKARQQTESREQTEKKAQENKAKADSEAKDFELGIQGSGQDVSAKQSDLLTEQPATTRTEKQGKKNQEKTAQKNPEKNEEKKSGKKAPEKTGKKSAEKPAEKIEDFGEKIGGARKDVWGGFRDALVDDLDLSILPLSKTFPQPDYVKLAEAGVDREVLGLIAAIRAEIPANKPRRSYRLEQWATNVKAARELARMMIDGERTAAQMRELMRTTEFRGFRPIADIGPVLAQVEPADLKKAGHYRIRSGHFNVFNGKSYPGGKTFWFLATDTRRVIDGTSGETLAAVQAKAVDYINQRLADESGSSGGRKTTFGVFQNRQSKQYWVGKKIAAGKYIKLKTGFDKVADARAFLKENQQWLEDELKKRKEIPAHRRETNHARKGRDYRKGKDVTPEDFGKAFGFRGVEFGNWVEQHKRQTDLNEAYDALHDLAELLGIPTQGISLNGELGLAFGARGRKGAKAHYEPDYVVINLTKKSGPGSLAHEWWHALDNYFARSRGDKHEFISRNIRKSVYDKAQGEWRKDTHVRDEVESAFQAVVEAIRATGLPKRSKALDGLRTKDYWSTMVEMTARTFETFVIDRLAVSGFENDYLANVSSVDAFSAAGVDYPYLLAAEEKAVHDAFEKLFKTIKHRKTDKGTQLYRYRDNPAKGMKRGPLSLKLAPLEKQLGFPVTVLQSETELPTDDYRSVVRDGAQGRVRGLFSHGRAYVIADNLDSVRDAVQTVLHEVVGHAGVRQVAGKRLDTVLDQLYRDMSDGLKKTLQTRYARQLQGKSDAQANRIIAEEYVAHLAERNPKNRWVQKVISVIRNALRRLFPNMEWRPEDVVELLASSRRALRNNGKESTERGQRYSDSHKADTFYSAVERGAAAVKSERLPAQSWLNAIKKYPNITDEEIQWLGLDIWLDSKKGQKLDKRQVLQFIRDNKIEIEEVRLDSYEPSQDEIDERMDWRERDFIEARLSDYNSGYYTEDIEDLLNDARDKYWDAEYDYYKEDLTSRYHSDDLEPDEAEAILDEDGGLDAGGIETRAEYLANNILEGVSSRELIDNYIDKSDLEEAAEAVYRDSGIYDEDRDDLDREIEEQSETKYREYATEGGDEYTELLLTLPDNQIWVRRAVEATHRIDEKELNALKQGDIPAGISIKRHDNLSYLYDNKTMWQPFRNYKSGIQEPIGSMVDSRQAVIDDLIEQAEAPALHPLPSHNNFHWSEGNVLAHVRFQTFMDTENNKVLLIDEVQSDWHQQGREKGYSDPYRDAEDDKLRLTIKELNSDLAAIKAQKVNVESEIEQAEKSAVEAYQAWLKKNQGYDVDSQVSRLNKLKDKMMHDSRQRYNKLYEAENNLIIEIKNHRKKVQAYNNAEPNAPLKQNWPNLVMKRMLRHAAENGFDRVAWTTGNQQARRYGNEETRHLKTIKVRPAYISRGDGGGFASGKVQLDIQTYDGSKLTVHSSPSLLEDHIGTRLANEVRVQLDKIKAGLDKQFDNYQVVESGESYQVRKPDQTLWPERNGSIRQFPSEAAAKEAIYDRIFSIKARDDAAFELDNLDEMVGGDQGMIAFYDNRLVNFIKKYTKKWGGKVGKVTLATGEGEQDFWSVPVTDKMKESVLKDGQPLFALRKNKRRVKRSNHKSSTASSAINNPQRGFQQRLRSMLNSKSARMRPIKVVNTPKQLIGIGAKDHSLTLARRVITKSTKTSHSVPMSVIERLPELLNDPELIFKGSKDDSYAVVIKAWEGDKPVMVAVNIKDGTIDSIHGRTPEQYQQYYKNGDLRYYKNNESLKLMGKSESSLDYSLYALIQYQGGERQPRDSDSRVRLVNAKTLVKQPTDQKDSGSDTRYALKKDLPDEVEKVINDIHGGIGKRRGWKQRVKDWLKEHPEISTAEGRYQGTLDTFHSIAEMERDSNDGKLLEGAHSAYKAALRTRNREGVMAALMGKGTPELKSGSVVFREGSKGFLEVLEPLAEQGELELWEVWAASKRAMRLLAEGRENLYTPERIKTVQAYVSSMPSMAKRFQQVFDDYQTFNSQILDFAEQAGLIDPESRKLWDKGDYIPFHRVHEVSGEAGEQSSVFRRKGLSGQKSGIKQLSGGVEKISPLEAMYRNTEALIDASFKNIAMQRIADLGEQTGAMEKAKGGIRLTAEDVKARLASMDVDTSKLTPEQLKRWKALLTKFTDLGEGTVTVSREGKASSYHVNDPLLLASITELGPQTISGLLKLLSIPKRVMTQLITVDPGFMLRNLSRDTLSTWMTVHPEINGKPLKVNPMLGAIRSLKKKIDNDDTRWSLMMAGGGGGGYYDLSPDNVRQKLSPAEQKRIINKPGQLWDAWQKFGSRFENANRLHVYERVIKQGGSVAEAAHQAQDVLNFTRKGQWQIINILVQTLPFFNARVQGLDRLWRGARADGKSGWAGIAPSFLLRGAGYMAASLGLLALYDDDKRYRSLPVWDKLNYHHVWLDGVHHRIPKPFEAGAIFGTLPEMIWQTSMGHEDLKWAKKMAGSMIFQTLAFDPVPQAFRPAMDIATNKNSFTDSPIIPLGLQYVKPEAQYDPWTSETMKQLVKAVPEGAPDWMRSPKKLQYLLEGYFGTIGRYVLAATDIGTRMAVDAPVRPALRARDLPVIGSFVRDGVDTTRYRSEMYEMQKELNDLVMTMNRYRDNGQRDKARKLKEDNREKLLARRGLNRYASRISRLRKQIRRVMENRVMTARVKRQRIDELSRQVNELSAEAVERYKGRF